MDRRVTVLFAALIVLVLIGEVLIFLHPAAHYDSSFKGTDDGFSYSFGPGTAGEYNIVVTDNGSSSAVEKMYLYCDKSYGYSYSYYDIDLYTSYLKNRLADRGFTNCEIINTSRLIEVVSQPSAKVGILICSGTIPEELIGGSLLTWVQSGGTLYWTWDIIGHYASRSDGTYYNLGTSLESDFLGSECTDSSHTDVLNLDSSNPYSKALNFENNWLWNAVDSSKLVRNYIKMGYADGNRTEITFVECGLGSVCVVSGATNRSQLTDIAQIVCAGITSQSQLIYHNSAEISLLQSYSNSFAWSKVSGHQYVGYVFLKAVNSPYGHTYRMVAA